MHMGLTQQCNWICKRIKHLDLLCYDAMMCVHVFERLCFTETFENFLPGRFTTLKRFGFHSREAIVLVLKGAIDSVSNLGAHSFIIRMPHSDRLNVLANAMRKLMATILRHFQGTHYNTDYHTKGRENWGGAGSVKVTTRQHVNALVN